MSDARPSSNKARPFGQDLAFLAWLGQRAIDGEMECGNSEAAEELRVAYFAGWNECRAQIDEARSRG